MKDNDLIKENITFMTEQAKTSRNEPPLWSTDFVLLFLSNFFLFFGAEMLSPVLPVYMANSGGNSSQIGMVMGSFTISAIIIRLASVKINEYFGQRAFLLAGLLVCALAAAGYYLTAVIALIFLLRVFHGFGFGAATTLYGAMVSNIIPRSRMGEGMGYFGLGIAIAAAIGPFLGTVIVSAPGYQWIFFLSSGLILVAILLTQSSKAGRAPVDQSRPSGAKFSISDFMEPKVILPSVLIFFVGISMAGIFTFIVLFGNEAKISHIGVFFLVTSLAEITIRPFSGKLFDHRGHLPVMVPGALAGFVGTVLLSISTSLPLLIAASVFYGIGIGMVYPVLEAWALRVVEPERRVAASATFYNFLDIGIGVGSVALGIIAQLSNYTCMYRYSSLVFILFLVVYLVYYFRSGKQKRLGGAAPEQR